jgi:hypothetical protein
MSKDKKFIRLCDLAKGSKIHGLSVKAGGLREQEVIVKFNHVDGMYSYNTVLDLKGKEILNKERKPIILHLAAYLLLKKVGRHYVVATEDEEAAFQD